MEQIDFLADSVCIGVAKQTCKIMARHDATSSLGAHANAGDRPLESKDVTEQPLDRRVSVTSIIPFGATICRGLWCNSGKEKKQ